MTYFKVSVKPCPCCGSADIEAGVESSQSHAVRCNGCGLKMERSSPEKWPQGVWKNGRPYAKNHTALNKWTLDKAVEAWNLRTDPSPLLLLTAHVS